MLQPGPISLYTLYIVFFANDAVQTNPEMCVKKSIHPVDICITDNTKKCRQKKQVYAEPNV